MSKPKRNGTVGFFARLDTETYLAINEMAEQAKDPGFRETIQRLVAIAREHMQEGR